MADADDPGQGTATGAPSGRAAKGAITAGFGLALATLIIDQLHKWWMINILAIKLESERIAVTPFMDFVYVLNKGISYGLFTQDSQAAQNAMAAFAFVVAACLGVWLARAAHARWAAAGIGLIMGGAVGNGIDRLHLGGVADFIQLHAFGWSWYVFNIADAAIVAGVAALIYDSLIVSRKSAAKGSQLTP